MKREWEGQVEHLFYKKSAVSANRF